MSARHLVLVIALTLTVAFTAFGLGGYAAHQYAALQFASNEARIDALRAELTRVLGDGRTGPAGTTGRVAPSLAMFEDGDREAVVDEIKRQLQTEMGLFPVQLLRDRRESFAELYTYDNYGSSSYGTAGYLGRGYFITVKHGVVALPEGRGEDEREPRQIVSIKLIHKGRALKATLVDAGDAETEVDPGDWAIVRVKERLNIPPLNLDLDYAYSFADPIFRLGNDYSKGIIVSTGYVGQKTANGLVTCLTDGHPGVSGGGVLSQTGDLVGIPIGRMQGDFRFSFILPLRADMFRKVPFLAAREGAAD